MRGLPGMPTRRDSCQDDRKDRTPRKYERLIRCILFTHGREKVTDWVLTHGTFFEVVWWNNHLRKADTGQGLTNAEQEALWGPRITLAIRVAGIRLQEKLVKAFLGVKL